MNQPIQKIIQQRYSCRSYTDEPINQEHRQAVNYLLTDQHTGPFGTRARFKLVAATQEDSRALKGLGTYGFIKNPAAFIIGALEQGPKNLEDYGFLLENVILTATGIGLGTCWLGGSFTKSSFAKKILLYDTETIPAVVAAGYIAGKNGKVQIRNFMNYYRRLPADQLFFADTFGRPLKPEEACEYIQPLEMVRIGPSASNKQPWRIIKTGKEWHFYLQRTKGYGKGTLLFKILGIADLQRVDMGIAMCHFELTARSLGLKGHWVSEEPESLRNELQVPEGTEYTVTWKSE